MGIPFMLYMVKKTTGYFFRMRLPHDVAAYFGRKEIIRSLHTARYKEAKSLTINHSAKAEKVFTMLRSGTLTDVMITKIVADFLEMAYTAAERVQNQETTDCPPAIHNRIDVYHRQLSELHELDYADRLKIPEDRLHRLAKSSGLELQDGFELLEQAGQEQAKELKRIKARNQTHELPIIKEMAASYLKKHGIPVEESSDKYRALCRELFRVEMQIDETINAWQQGEETDLDTEIRQKLSCKKLSALIQQYESEKVASWSDPARMKSTHRQILHLLGDVRLNMIDRAMLIQFREDLKRYPCNLRGAAFERPWKELSAKATRFLSDASQQFIFSELNTLLTYGSAVNMGVQGLPGKGLLKAKKDLVRVKNRIPYSTQELQLMIWALSQVDRERHPDTFWIPLLLLHTGARSNDICMLRCADVVEQEGMSLLLFRHDLQQQQRTKSEENRQIPIHRHLIEIGFLDYVRARRGAGHDRLFPLKQYHDKWNVSYGKAFNRTFKLKFLQGYSKEELSARDLHSFRKNLISWYVKHVLIGDAGNFIKDLATLQSMIGHLEADELKGILQYIGKSTLTLDLYGGGLAGNGAEQNELLQRLDYGLDLTPLMPI